MHLFNFCQIPALFMSRVPSVGLWHFQTLQSLLRTLERQVKTQCLSDLTIVSNWPALCHSD